MNKIVLLCLFFVIVSQSAHSSTPNFKVICHVQDYLCPPQNPDKCVWGKLMGHEKVFDLNKNTAYPNPSYPNEIWEGEISDVLHYPAGNSRYTYRVKVVVTPKGKKSYKSWIEYEWGDHVGYAEGLGRIGVGVIDKKLIGSTGQYPGRGYFCWGAELTS